MRYRTIEEQIRTRIETAADFSAGVQRFITGLAKKLILANSFAPVADYMFGHIDSLSVISAWDILHNEIFNVWKVESR